jgi:hypothetical protein
VSASPRAHCIPSFPASLSWSAFCLKTALGLGASVLVPIALEVIIVDAPCLERFLYFDAPAYASKAIDLTVISTPKLENIVCLKEDWFCHPRLVFGTTAMQVGMTSFFLSMNMF